MRASETTTSIAPLVAEKIRKRREELALRGTTDEDPWEELAKLFRERYVLEDLLPDPALHPVGTDPWVFDDSDDEG